MKIGMVSTVSCECGIATYTQHLVEHYPEDTIIFGNKLNDLTDTGALKNRTIIRCWERTGDLKQLEQEVINSGVDVLHIQHEFGLFQDHESFLRLLTNLKKRGVRLFITFHTVFDTKPHNQKIYDYAKYLSRIIVHHKDAVKELGLYNVACVPHGSVTVKAKDQTIARDYLKLPHNKTIALSLGFITPNKAVGEVITAINSIKHEYPDLYYVIAGQAVAHGFSYGNLEYAVKLYKQIERFQLQDTVKLITRFIPEEELDYWVGACDFMVENYHQTFYSTSGMSHLVMSYGKASISSNSRILSDLDETRSVKYNMMDVKDIAEKLKIVMKDKELTQKHRIQCLRYAQETSWPNIAKRHLEIYNGAL